MDGRMAMKLWSPKRSVVAFGETRETEIVERAGRGVRGLEKYWRRTAVLRGREFTEVDCGGFNRGRRLCDVALRVSEFADQCRREVMMELANRAFRSAGSR